MTDVLERNHPFVDVPSPILHRHRTGLALKTAIDANQVQRWYRALDGTIQGDRRARENRSAGVESPALKREVKQRGADGAVPRVQWSTPTEWKRDGRRFRLGPPTRLSGGVVESRRPESARDNPLCYAECPAAGPLLTPGAAAVEVSPDGTAAESPVVPAETATAGRLRPHHSLRDCITT